MKIGIAGKMASGKTLIAAELEKHGFKIFPLDGYARKLRKKGGPLYFFFKENFKNALKKNGALNTAAIKTQIASSASLRKKTNRFFKKHVKEELKNLKGDTVVEGANIFELGLEKELDAVIGVIAPEKDILKRAASSKNWKKEDIKKMLDAQITDDKLLEKCGIIIYNNSSITALKEKTRRVTKQWRHKKAKY